MLFVIRAASGISFVSERLQCYQKKSVDFKLCTPPEIDGSDGDFGVDIRRQDERCGAGLTSNRRGARRAQEQICSATHRSFRSIKRVIERKRRTNETMAVDVG